MTSETPDSTLCRDWRLAVTTLAALADWLEREAVPAHMVEDPAVWDAFLRELWPVLRAAWSAQTQEEIQSAALAVVELMKQHLVLPAFVAWLPPLSPQGYMFFSFGADLGDVPPVRRLSRRHRAAVRAALASMLRVVDGLEQAQESKEVERADQLEGIAATVEPEGEEGDLPQQPGHDVPPALGEPSGQGREEVADWRHAERSSGTAEPEVGESDLPQQPGHDVPPALGEPSGQGREKVADWRQAEEASGTAEPEVEAGESPQQLRHGEPPGLAEPPEQERDEIVDSRPPAEFSARAEPEVDGPDVPHQLRLDVPAGLSEPPELAEPPEQESEAVVDSRQPEEVSGSAEPEVERDVPLKQPRLDQRADRAQDSEVPERLAAVGRYPGVAAGGGLAAIPATPRTATGTPSAGRVAGRARRHRRVWPGGRVLRALLMAAKSLLSRPARTTLTMFGIILGVSVIVAVSITNASTLSSLNSAFAEVSGNSDLMVMSATVDREGFAEDTTKRVVAVPGVKVAAPSVHAHAVLAGQTSDRELQAGILGGVEQRLAIYGVDPQVDPEVRIYKVVEGEWLANDLDLYEIVLVKDFARDEALEVGDDLPLVTPNGIELVRIIGLMSKEGAGQLNNGLYGAMPLGAVQRMFNRAGDLDQIDIMVSEEASTRQGIETLRHVLGEKLGERFSVTFPASQGERVSQMLGVYQMGLGMFGVIAVFVGAFLIYNAFSMTVVERTREIGMLRTIGMTRGQVTRRILVEAVLLGVAGSGLGIVGGLLLAGGLIRAMAALIAREVPATSIPGSGLVSGLAVGMIATLLAALIPSWQAGRVSPLEALRVRARHREGWLVRRGWIPGAALVTMSLAAYLVLDVPPSMQFPITNGAILGLFLGATLLTPLAVGPWQWVIRPLIRVVFGGEGRLGGSNIQRAKNRTTMTVTALMVGVSMLLSMRAMSASFQRDLSEWIEGYMGGDLIVYSATPMLLEFGGRLEAIEGVRAASPSRLLNVTAVRPGGSDETLAMNVVDPLKHEQVGSFTFTATMGDAQKSMARLAEGDAVFLSTLIADRYGLRVGDKLTIQTRRGPREFEVAGVVVDFMEQGMVVQGSWRDMRQYFRVDDVSSFRISVDTGHDPQDVMDAIEDIYGTRRNLGTFSNEAVKEMALGITAQTTGLFSVLSWIAVIVASLGVVNTLLMNVMERTREIGMLRGVGMTRWQVVRMVLAEAAVMGTIGGALGIGVGTVLARVFIVGANTMQGYTLTYVMPAQALGFALLVAVGVSQVAALWPSGRAARLRVIEAIQFE